MLVKVLCDELSYNVGTNLNTNNSKEMLNRTIPGIQR